MNSKGKIKLAITRLLHRYPLHGGIISGWNPCEDKKIETMSVGVEGVNVRLRFNSDFVESLKLDEVIAVLIHEINHILGEHLWMTNEKYPDENALVIATEVTANQYVNEPLPCNPVLLKDFPELQKDEDAHTRYKKLEGKYKSKIKTLDNHAKWEQLNKNPELSKAIIGLEIATALESLSNDQKRKCSSAILKKAGKIAGEAKISSSSNNGNLNWKNILRFYVGQAISRRPSFGKPPRRYPKLIGIVPAHSFQGSKPKILAVIDTSASLSEEMLNDISAELTRLAKENEVTVVECDREIRSVYKFKPIEKLKGRGGTDLRPALKKSFLKKYGAELVVYFTDGYGSAPENKPNVPLIWCITENGQKPASYGREIRLNSNEKVRKFSDSHNNSVQDAHFSVHTGSFSVHSYSDYKDKEEQKADAEGDFSIQSNAFSVQEDMFSVPEASEQNKKGGIRA